MNTIFKNAAILKSDGTITEGCLGVVDNLIAFVGSAPPDFKAQRAIDCEGNLLLPGLVNAHTHMPMVLFRSIADDMPLWDWLSKRIFPMEDALDGDAAYWAAQLAMAEMIRGGTACVSDMYMYEDEIMQAAALSGIRGLFCRSVVTEEGSVNKRLEESIRLYNEWHGTQNGRIRVCVGPHAEYTCNDETLRKIGEAALKLGCKLHVHVSETYHEHEECKRRHVGKTPVMVLDECGLLHENALLAHCVEVEPGDIALIADKGAHVLHCPQSNLKLGCGIAPVPLMQASRINIALGTDGAASNNNLDMFEELRLAATLHKGITMNATTVTAREALRMATVNGARALGFPSGILEAGSLADIILIDTKAPHMLPRTNLLHSAVYSAGAADVLLNMVDGRVLYEHGEFYTLDLERIAVEIKRIMERFYPL